MIPIPVGLKCLGVNSILAPQNRMQDFNRYIGQTFDIYPNVNHERVNRWEFVDNSGYRSGWFANEQLKWFIYAKKPTVIICQK